MSETARTAQDIAMWISHSFWSVFIIAILLIIYTFTLYRKSKKTCYLLVLTTVYFGIVRVFVIQHIVTSRTTWVPDMETKVLWLIYYILLVLLISLSTRYTKKIWGNIGWFNKLTRVGLTLAVLYYGFTTIYTPYSIILK